MWNLLRFWTIAALYILGAAIAANGQGPLLTTQFDCSKEKDPFSSYCKDINQFLSDAAANKNTAGKVDRTNPQVLSDLRTFLFVDSSPDRFSSLLAEKIALQSAISLLPASPDTSRTTMAALSGLNQNRPDQQTSAGSNTSGTTSLVEKAGAPAILALALESGALTRSTSGNTATLTGNADGLVRALTGKQVLCFDCPGALGTPILRNLNLAAAFLAHEQSTSSVMTSGPANPSTPSSVISVAIPRSVGKLSSLAARYQLWNPYDPRSSQFKAAWADAVAAAKTQIDIRSKDFQDKLVTLLNNRKISNDAKFQRVLEVYRGVFYDDADAGDLPKLRQDFLDLYNASVSAWTNDDPEFSQKVADLNVSLAQYKALWNQLLEKAKGQPLLTLEYAFNQPQNQPETHDFRLIYGYTPKASAVGLLSLNAAISVYGGTIPAGARYGRLHSGQISAEYDRSIRLRDSPNQATFSLAAYWQYQPDPSVLNITLSNLAPGTNIQLPSNAQVLLGAAGSLWVTQAKVTINGKSGIKIPIAVKWSNKTDLVVGNNIGAQVGISYDFSSLSNLFGGAGENQ